MCRLIHMIVCTQNESINIQKVIFLFPLDTASSESNENEMTIVLEPAIARCDFHNLVFVNCVALKNTHEIEMAQSQVL